MKNAPRYDCDRVVEGYDQWYETPCGALYDRLEKKAIGRLLPYGGSAKRLLEIGCGTGHWSAFFSAQGYQVTGVDISENMLMKAKQKSLANCRFERADAHDLSFASDSYDVVPNVEGLRLGRSSRPSPGTLSRWPSPSPAGVKRKLSRLASNSRSQVAPRRKA